MRVEKTFNHQFGKVMERYHAFAREHNEAQFITKSTMLREPHLSKFKAISGLYLKHFWNMMNSPLWADSDIIPTVNITRWDLANLCNCSQRAVQDHLARLSTYGVIDVEEPLTAAEGQVGYRINVNLFLLLGIEEYKPKIKAWSAKATCIFKKSSLTSKQSLPDFNNPKDESLNNIDKADCVENQSQGRHHEKTQEKGEIAKPLELNQGNDQEKNGGAAEISENPPRLTGWDAYKSGNYHANRTLVAPKPAPNYITDIEKAMIVNNFWEFAKKLFYPNQRFVDKVEREIKNTIRKDVFGDFLGNGTFNFWQVESMKAQYWAEKKQAWDAQHDRVAYWPVKYFAKEYGNPKKQGFLVVKQWEAKASKSLKEVEFEKELQKAQLAILAFKIPNGQKGKIHDIIGLTQYYHRKLTVKTNSEYVQKFAQFLTTSNYLKSCQQQAQY